MSKAEAPKVGETWYFKSRQAVQVGDVNWQEADNGDIVILRATEPGRYNSNASTGYSGWDTPCEVIRVIDFDDAQRMDYLRAKMDAMCKKLQQAEANG